MQRSDVSSWTQGTPAGLPPGMPGIALLIDGAMQHAAQRGRHCAAAGGFGPGAAVAVAVAVAMLGRCVRSQAKLRRIIGAVPCCAVPCRAALGSGRVLQRR